MIKDFFSALKSKTPKEVKKVKRIAANKKISLKEERKKFCKYCLNPFSGSEKIRIKKKVKSVICNKCGKESRWKVR